VTYRTYSKVTYRTYSKVTYRTYRKVTYRTYTKMEILVTLQLIDLKYTLTQVFSACVTNANQLPGSRKFGLILHKNEVVLLGLLQVYANKSDLLTFT